MALATIELLTPAWLATLTGTFEKAGIAYAIVAAIGFAASGVGAELSMRLIRIAGSPARAGMAGLLVMALALAGLAATTVLSGLIGVVAAAAMYFVTTLAQVNRAVTPRRRPCADGGGRLPARP